VLAEVSLQNADPDEIRQLVSVHGALYGASEEEREAARQTVARVLAHEVGLVAATAERDGRCWREMPVSCRLSNGLVLEGTVDLAYEERGQMVVVDYKTDHDVGESLDDYRRQVRAYATAVARATDRPVRGLIVSL
jgi:ATP-dependent exoDNAse (exonuclease V) beta subunit